MIKISVPAWILPWVIAPAVFCQNAEQLMVQQQFFNHYGKIYQKGTKGPDIVGPQFLYDDWRPMKIKTKDFEVELSAVKINLFNSTLEVLYEGKEKIMLARDFEYLTFQEGGCLRKMVPALRFKKDGTPLEGFMEIAGHEPVQVIVHHYTGVKEPGPSANIVGGHTDNFIVKLAKTYIYAEGKLIEIKNRKQFVKYFKSNSSKAEQLFRETRPDMKDPCQLYELLKKIR